ncbi:pH-response transcription factor pacC/RIM101 [Verticillium dahliae VdLs.17]|uniref:PH-response transcription factor pacC/RIM101 n=1 Tax=Verticillium dahliae (strain VdLs.17 / ATCC MYA-4575 / FGSC 10137) TaxID=498257 RepID=G2XFQ3_VERDV|nr:pH-response transcription factor pacC/RIM101 [Verticillium dahliae VdLs.17]EGY18651.1 pH-response transcription factor pacC/RIM101 [Verticillium dahliae VdLs.17]
MRDIIGRKSTKNPNLTCQWDSCCTAVPHKCEFCGKSFKRPQDLKKHVKTHADDSVLIRSPQDQASKASSSYYDHNSHNQTNSAAFSHQDYRLASDSGSGAPTLSHSLGLYYAPTRGPQYLGHHAAAGGFDTRKRVYDMVDDFFASAKHHHVDPSSYSRVSRSLMPLHEALTLQTGDPIPTTEHIACPQHPGPNIGYYLPPMFNTRTKNDLFQIDQILDQMQSTVFENANSATHGIHARGQIMFEYRHNPSSPGVGHRGSAGTTPMSQDDYAADSDTHIAFPQAAISSTGTPAITPPSSNTSYASGQSPSLSSSDMSPHSTATSVMYPNLPVVSSVFPGQSTTPTLGTNFDNNQRRNYGGGMLQRASSASVRHRSDTSTVTQVMSKGTPASLGSPPSESDMSERACKREERYDQCVKNMRTIDALREYIRERIARKDFDEKTDERDERRHSPDAMNVDSRRITSAETSATPPAPAALLYPILRLSN